MLLLYRSHSTPAPLLRLLLLLMLLQILLLKNCRVTRVQIPPYSCSAAAAAFPAVAPFVQIPLYSCSVAAVAFAADAPTDAPCVQISVLKANDKLYINSILFNFSSRVSAPGIILQDYGSQDHDTFG